MNTAPDWKVLHDDRRRFPKTPHERALCKLIDGLKLYQQASASLGYRIADDGVLGEHYRNIVTGVVGLLDGETGKLDCGTLWSEVDCIALDAGWKGIDGARADETTPAQEPTP